MKNPARGPYSLGLGDWHFCCTITSGGFTMHSSFSSSAKKVQDMKSEHIDGRKLDEVVTEKAVLEDFEVEHLKTCEECMELVRLFVRQNLFNSARK